MDILEHGVSKAVSQRTAAWSEGSLSIKAVGSRLSQDVLGNSNDASQELSIHKRGFQIWPEDQRVSNPLVVEELEGLENVRLPTETRLLEQSAAS